MTIVPCGTWTNGNSEGNESLEALLSLLTPGRGVPCCGLRVTHDPFTRSFFPFLFPPVGRYPT